MTSKRAAWPRLLGSLLLSHACVYCRQEPSEHFLSKARAVVKGWGGRETVLVRGMEGSFQGVRDANTHTPSNEQAAVVLPGQRGNEQHRSRRKLSQPRGRHSSRHKRVR